MNTKPNAPYFRPPHLQIKVLCEKSSPKVLKWEFSENSARPKLIKNNKIAVISDGQTITKITLFEEFSSKIKTGQSYIMKGYGLRGQSPPFSLNITKETFYRSAPLKIDEALSKEATDILFPNSTCVSIHEAPTVQGLLTMEGKIVQLSTVRRVTTGWEEVAVRHITLEQEQRQVNLTLWREAAVQTFDMGAQIKVTHISMKTSAYGDQFHTTGYTEIEAININENSPCEVLGVSEATSNGEVELLLSTDQQVSVEASLWEPFDSCLAEGRVYVMFFKEKGRVVKIERVQPTPEK